MASSFTPNENAASNRSSQMNIELQSMSAVNFEHEDETPLSFKKYEQWPSGISTPAINHREPCPTMEITMSQYSEPLLHSRPSASRELTMPSTSNLSLRVPGRIWCRIPWSQSTYPGRYREQTARVVGKSRGVGCFVLPTLLCRGRGRARKLDRYVHEKRVCRSAYWAWTEGYWILDWDFASKIRFKFHCFQAGWEVCCCVKLASSPLALTQFLMLNYWHSGYVYRPSTRTL